MKQHSGVSVWGVAGGGANAEPHHRLTCSTHRWRRIRCGRCRRCSRCRRRAQTTVQGRATFPVPGSNTLGLAPPLLLPPRNPLRGYRPRGEIRRTPPPRTEFSRIGTRTQDFFRRPRSSSRGALLRQNKWIKNKTTHSPSVLKKRKRKTERQSELSHGDHIDAAMSHNMAAI